MPNVRSQFLIPVLTIVHSVRFLLMRYFLLTLGLALHSCANQEERQVERDQVQDPMQTLPLHTQAEGLGQSGQTKAKLTSWYGDGTLHMLWHS